MDEKNLFTAVLTQISQNQLAMGAAIEELTNWVEGTVRFFVCGPVTACRQAGRAFTR